MVGLDGARPPPKAEANFFSLKMNLSFASIKKLPTNIWKSHCCHEFAEFSTKSPFNELTL